MEGYSVTDVEAFMDWAVDKGLVKRNTGISRKTAVTKVLGSLDPDEQTDVRTIDLAQAVSRWQNKKAAGYTPKSLAVYERRAKLAVREFLKYKQDPKNYKPGGQTRKSSQGTKSKKTVSQLNFVADADGFDSEGSLGSPSTGSTAPALVFSIPIRPGVAALVRVTGLPWDMSTNEARSAAALTTAILEPQLQALARGHEEVSANAGSKEVVKK